MQSFIDRLSLKSTLKANQIQAIYPERPDQWPLAYPKHTQKQEQIDKCNEQRN